MRNYVDFCTTGDIQCDVKEYFSLHNRKDVYKHTLDVVEELNYIRNLTGHIEDGSLIACYCHDLGQIVEKEDIVSFCQDNDISLLEGERRIPSIAHQKVSCFLAEKVFKISNSEILDAIRYHTTSRKNPGNIEIEVFLADKMSWKEAGYRELAFEIKETIRRSKEAAMLYYLENLNSCKDDIPFYHPDSQEAYDYFKNLVLDKK